MRAIQKVTSGQLLTKSNKTILLYTKKYIFKLLLNVVTTGIEGLVSGNKFRMPVSKKSATCELSHVLYCETIEKLHRCSLNKRCGMLTFSVVLLHDNARQHTATYSCLHSSTAVAFQP
jgi:hypothetical protein